MKSIKIKLTGMTYLLIHNDQGADPLNIYSKKIKQISSKKKKTEADNEIMARLEWESGLYLFDGQIKIPAENVERCIEEGGKKNKKGKDIRKFIQINDDFLSLKYNGEIIKGILQPKSIDDIPIVNLDKFFSDFSDRRAVKIGKNKIMRTRPIFRDWSLVFELLYEEKSINKEEIILACEIAGREIGLCEHNIQRFGRFNVEVFN